MEQAQNICEISHSLFLIPFDGNRETMLREVSSVLSPVFACANRDTEDSVMPGYERPGSILGDTFKAVTLSGKGVELTAFKRSDSGNGLIVRLRSRTDETVEGKLSLNLPGVCFGDVFADDLEENRLEKIGRGNEISFTAPPHKLLTFEFEI